MANKNKKKINKIIKELSDCAKGLNKGELEFWLTMRNGIQDSLMGTHSSATVEFSWSLLEKGTNNYEDEVSRGIYRILRELNDMPSVRSLKREILIYSLPVKCFNNQMEEIAKIASMMSKKRNVLALGEYIREIKSRRIVNVAEGQARIKGGDFLRKQAPKGEIGRENGPKFSIKIHYISSSQCEVEVYMDCLEEKFGNLDSEPSIDIDPIFEMRVFSRKYCSEELLKERIYFCASGANAFDALKCVIDKIKAHYKENK